jgi:hypothetical protein
MDDNALAELRAPTATPIGLILNLLTAFAIQFRNNRCKAGIPYTHDDETIAYLCARNPRVAALAEKVAAAAQATYNESSIEANRTKRTPETVMEDAMMNPVFGPNLEPISFFANLFGSWMKSVDKPYQDKKKQQAADEEALRQAKASERAVLAMEAERAEKAKRTQHHTDGLEGHFKHALNDLEKRTFNGSTPPIVTKLREVYQAQLTQQQQQQQQQKQLARHKRVAPVLDIADILNSTLSKTDIHSTSNSKDDDALKTNEVVDHLVEAYQDLGKRKFSKEDAPFAAQLRKAYLIHLDRHTRALGDDIRVVAKRLNVTIANITSEIGDGVMEVGRDMGETVVRVGVDLGGSVARVGGDIVNSSETIYNHIAHPKGDVVDTVVQVTKDVANGLRRVTSDVTSSVERIGTDIADSSARLFNTIVGRFGRLEQLFHSGISAITSGNNEVKDTLHTLDSRVRRSAENNRIRPLPADGWNGVQQQIPQLYNDQGQYIAHRAPSQHHLMARGAGRMYQPQQPPPPPPPLPVQAIVPRDEDHDIRNGVDTVTVHIENQFGAEVETSYTAHLTHISGFHYTGNRWSADADRKFYTRRSAIDNDERGHVIARVLGGPSERWNLQPQTWSMNHGYGEPLNWRIVENHVIAWLDVAGQSVDWFLELDYHNGGPRPSQYRLLVTYLIEQQGVDVTHHTEFIACPNVLYGNCVTQ